VSVKLKDGQMWSYQCEKVHSGQDSCKEIKQQKLQNGNNLQEYHDKVKVSCSKLLTSNPSTSSNVAKRKIKNKKKKIKNTTQATHSSPRSSNALHPMSPCGLLITRI